MPSGSLRKFLYRWSFDTRCRNIDVARVLSPFVSGETTVLDAGCGEFGISAFVPSRRIVGIDVVSSGVPNSEVDFVHGSILCLPFADASFSLAASVDVLEHLPEDLRGNAIKELVRAARDVIVVAFPNGTTNRKIDEEFRRRLVASNRPVPDWLTEHLENQYPESEAVIAEIENEARRLGRSVTTTEHYSEALSVAKFLRRLAVNAQYLYILGNLAAGLMLAFLPRATKGNSYRSIIVAEFNND